jgi:hypothetical protein
MHAHMETCMQAYIHTYTHSSCKAPRLPKHGPSMHVRHYPNIHTHTYTYKQLLKGSPSLKLDKVGLEVTLPIIFGVGILAYLFGYYLAVPW